MTGPFFMRRGRRVWTGVVFAAALTRAAHVSAATSCEALTAHRLDHASVVSAATVAANAPPFYVARPFCRVQITMTPTADSDIRVEVWLPIGHWNGKFEAVGNGDAAGVISYDDMAAAVARGFATSSTDTGHVGNSMAFALGHHEKYVDFGYRAVHEMTVKAKAIIAAYYGAPPREAYWNGCSQGGRQGITEAARYPSDYDGVIAGAPAIEYMQLHAARLALNLLVHRSADSYIPPEKYALIHRAALEACDRGDGVRDGLIADPTRCRFDPGRLACTGADAPTCLTPAQVERRATCAPELGLSSGEDDSRVPRLSTRSTVQSSSLASVVGLARSICSRISRVRCRQTRRQLHQSGSRSSRAAAGC